MSKPIPSPYFGGPPAQPSTLDDFIAEASTLCAKYGLQQFYIAFSKNSPLEPTSQWGSTCNIITEAMIAFMLDNLDDMTKRFEDK